MAGSDKKWFQKLGSSIATRFAKVETAVTKLEHKIVVAETVTINTGTYKEYNVAALLGADVASYDLTKIDTVVRVQDTDAGSATQGFAINSEGVITCGVKPTGVVRIANIYSANLSVDIRIVVLRK